MNACETYSFNFTAFLKKYWFHEVTRMLQFNDETIYFWMNLGKQDRWFLPKYQTLCCGYLVLFFVFEIGEGKDQLRELWEPEFVDTGEKQ